MILRHDALPSTNDEALRLAAEGAAAFTVVVADAQSAGRGRNGRAWQSPPGVGLYASMILRPALPLGELPRLSLLVGVAAAEAIRAATGLAAGLKWPNDVLVNDRKVAGILCEASPNTGDADAPVVVAGLGVNVNTLPQDLPERPVYPASSLAAESGRLHDRDALLDAWIARSRHWMAVVETQGAAPLVERWNALDALAGQRISINNATGIARGVDATGALRVETDAGSTSIIVGDIGKPSG
ncbi:MAG: biotin--[acetyl-CoA-carboxylase] ligase [Kiritimatiellia bacterium]|jgi:BirA family biotin operon repressor/biotin-[acetyl-CoA-carboxylase] ligase